MEQEQGTIREDSNFAMPSADEANPPEGVPLRKLGGRVINIRDTFGEFCGGPAVDTIAMEYQGGAKAVEGGVSTSESLRSNGNLTPEASPSRNVIYPPAHAAVVEPRVLPADAQPFIDPLIRKALFDSSISAMKTEKLNALLHESSRIRCLDALTQYLFSTQLINLEELTLILEHMPRKAAWSFVDEDGQKQWKSFGVTDLASAKKLKSHNWVFPVDLALLSRALEITDDHFGLRDFGKVIEGVFDVAQKTAGLIAALKPWLPACLVVLDNSLGKLKDRLISHDATGIAGYDSELDKIFRREKHRHTILDELGNFVRAKETLSISDLICIIAKIPYGQAWLYNEEKFCEEIRTSLKEGGVSDFSITSCPVETYVLFNALKKARAQGTFRAFQFSTRLDRAISFGYINISNDHDETARKVLGDLLKKEAITCLERLNQAPK